MSNPAFPDVGPLPEAASLSALPLRLRALEVDLWRVPLDTPSDEWVEQLGATLSEDEQTRAEAFHFERDCRRFVVGRGLLRVLLGRYLDRAPQELVFTYGAHGKPRLPDEEVHFNLAHSEGLAVFAFTRVGEVGIDLERVRELPDWPAITATCFPADERKRVERAAPVDRLAEFFRAWTRQEARLKAMGTGFGADDPGPDHGLRLHALHVMPGFEAALAVPGEAQWATCFSWEDSRRSERSRPVRRSPRVKLQPMVNGRLEFL